MKPAFLLLTFLLSFATATAYAQDDLSPKTDSIPEADISPKADENPEADASPETDSSKNSAFGSYMILPFELPVVDAKAMNQELGKFGYPGLKAPTAAVGYGLQLYTNRIITTFSFNKTSRKEDTDLLRHEVEYRATSFNIGYDVLRHYQFSLYPYVGYKGTGLNYLYQEKPQEIWTFEDYLKSDTDTKEFTTSVANLDLGLGWSFQTFYLLNLKAGYLVPLEKQNWKINNNQDLLRQSPLVTNRFYFVLSIGLGNISQEKKKKVRSVMQEQHNDSLLQQI